MEISTVLSITLTFVSMIVGFFIAYRQGKELNNSKEITTKTFSISEETKSIAEKLSTNRMVTERVQKIFLLDPKGGEPCSNYRISYPVKYDNRPLPFINQGDFYAIHILSLALGMNNVELRELEPGKDESSIKGNIIFICGPQSNTILNKLYPFASTIKNNDETYVEEFKKGNVQHFCKNKKEIIAWLKEFAKLPCWFIDEYQIPEGLSDKDKLNIDSLEKIKKIQIFDKDDNEKELQLPKESPSEDYYRKARAIKGKVPFGPVEDFGIFARITDKKDNSRRFNRHIIISGVHQYGTWIISDYINNILRTEREKLDNEKHLDVFKNSDVDFIAVVSGTYSSKKMSVEHSEIDGDKFWVRPQKESHWIRYKNYSKMWLC